MVFSVKFFNSVIQGTSFSHRNSTNNNGEFMRFRFRRIEVVEPLTSNIIVFLQKAFPIIKGDLAHAYNMSLPEDQSK